MRTLVLGGAVVAALVLLGAGMASRGPDRSSCGRVGDRERAVSPDGRLTAFVRCSAEGSAWLYLAGERGELRLVPRQYNCCYRPSGSVVFRDPAWAPDGRRLAVVIDDVGGADVWVIDAAGRSARRVTTGPARERRPRWSLDGNRVTFLTEVGGVGSASVP